MANIPRLDELVVAANFRWLFSRPLVYFDKENRIDIDFVNGLHNLWAELLERINERQLFITELEGLCPLVMMYKILKFLNEVQNHDVIQLLELRKIIVGTHRHVSRKIALIKTIRSLLLTSELNVFGGPLAVQCAEFLKQLSQKEVLGMLELRKTIAEVHIQMGMLIMLGSIFCGFR
ncbi:hypothetical protein Tco_0272513 [Tanacetum coccineum]